MNSENEKLRGLLRDVRVLLANSSYKISGTAALLSSIDAALSQRAEPAGAQDDGRSAFQAYLDDCAAHDIEPSIAGAFHFAWQASPAQTEQQPVVPTLTPAELEDLREFHEAVCCAAGHRVEKQGMRRLAEIGAVESVGFGKHRLTEFGTYLLASLSAQGAKP